MNVSLVIVDVLVVKTVVAHAMALAAINAHLRNAIVHAIVHQIANVKNALQNNFSIRAQHEIQKMAFI